jgi:hypothetical protein
LTGPSRTVEHHLLSSRCARVVGEHPTGADGTVRPGQAGNRPVRPRLVWMRQINP